MLCNGAQCQRWKKCQRGKNVYDENQDNGKRNRVRPQRAGRFIDKVLFHQRPGNGQLDDDGKVPAEEHGQTGGDIPETGIIRQALKTGTVVGGGGGIFIQHLAQAVKARIGDALPPGCGAHCQRGKRKDEQR